ncbi:hypothetical protein Ddye_014225 [Dipteronia dyeriana]|uniref:RNase H type-1 domain-containing protein n=1 Tax=Dipteronia dyeriana TaxID=168575 RepID=A0AAE0CKD9_9ROSI|nr:hypothetical protein Ddye_014225 [Dipteronia dyeriana]
MHPSLLGPARPSQQQYQGLIDDLHRLCARFWLIVAALASFSGGVFFWVENCCRRVYGGVLAMGIHCRIILIVGFLDLTLLKPGSSGLNPSEDWWKFLWRIWQACCDLLPARVNLAKRRVFVGMMCPICNRRPETSLHAIWCCPSLKQMGLSPGFLDDFKRANGNVASASPLRPSTIASWKAPEVGEYKVNTDAAINVVGGVTRIGLIIRDSGGSVFLTSAQSICHCSKPQIVDALAIYKGILLAGDSSFIPLCIESDAQVVVYLLNSLSDPLSEIGLILKDIRLLLEDSPCCSVKFVSRLSNMAVHGHAKFGLSIETDLFWMEETPPVIVQAVLDLESVLSIVSVDYQQKKEADSKAEIKEGGESLKLVNGFVDRRWLQCYAVGKLKEFSSMAVVNQRLEDRGFVWIECSGIPLCHWNVSFFKKLGGALGEFILSERDALFRRRLDRCRMLVAVLKNRSIPKFIKVGEGVWGFNVAVEKEESMVVIAWLTETLEL